MQILVVEDNEVKFKAISKFLTNHYSCTIKHTANEEETYIALDHSPWDLLLLDMTFHVSAGEGHESDKEQLAGVNILQYMLAEKLKSPVIVVTRHTMFSGDDGFNISTIAELDETMKLAFPNIYKGVIKYDVDDVAGAGWQQEMTKKIKGIFGDASSEYIDH